MIEGRRFVGAEKTEHYAGVAEARIRKASGGMVTGPGLQDVLELEGAS